MADAKICDICGHVITKHEEKESFVQALGVGLSKFFGGTKEEKRPALHCQPPEPKQMNIWEVLENGAV